MCCNNICRCSVQFLTCKGHTHDVSSSCVDNHYCDSVIILLYPRGAHLTIIELTMWLAGNRLLQRLIIRYHPHKNRRLCSRPHSHGSVIFFVFLAFIVFTLNVRQTIKSINSFSREMLNCNKNAKSKFGRTYEF